MASSVEDESRYWTARKQLAKKQEKKERQVAAKIRKTRESKAAARRPRKPRGPKRYYPVSARWCKKRHYEKSKLHRLCVDCRKQAAQDRVRCPACLARACERARRMKARWGERVRQHDFTSSDAFSSSVSV